MVCVNNLKQHGMAIHLYAGDYDDRLPFTMTGPTWNGNAPTDTFYRQIGVYLGTSRAVYECPGFNVDNFGNTNIRGTLQIHGGETVKAFRTYYDNNHWAADNPDNSTRWDKIPYGPFKWNYSLPISHVDGSTIVMVDYINRFHAFSASYGQINYAPAIRGISMGTHQNKGACAVFMDGSARYVERKEWMHGDEFKLNNDLSAWMYNSDNNFGVYWANQFPPGTRWKWTD
jgi:hypothetical protein